MTSCGLWVVEPLSNQASGWPFTRSCTIGKGAVIGGNVWVTQDVPAGGRVAQEESRTDALANGMGAA